MRIAISGALFYAALIFFVTFLYLDKKVNAESANADKGLLLKYLSYTFLSANISRIIYCAIKKILQKFYNPCNNK